MIEIALFITGIIAGLVNAIAGGGILFVLPVLLLAGVQPLVAAMTCSLISVPGLVAAVFGYRKDLKKVPRSFAWLAVPCAIGGIAGAFLLVNTPSTTFERILPWLVLMAVLLFAFQPQLHRHIHKPAHMRKTSPMIILGVLLILVSLYGGYFGAGFGFILLALLSFTKLKSGFQINGMKNLLAVAIAGSCSAIFLVFGEVNIHYALAPMVGTMIGAYLGTLLAHRISPHATRTAIIGSGAVVVTLLFVDVF